MNRRVVIALNLAWNLVNFRAGLICALVAEVYEVVAVAPHDEYAPRLAALGAGGIPEVVVDGETGLIVDGDGRSGWLAAMSRLVASPELRARMATAGRRCAENEFNRPVQIAKVMGHCMEVAHG